MKFFLYGLMLITSIGLHGCSLLNIQQDNAKLNQIQTWQVRGKLSITSPEDSVTGYLTWEQQDDNYDLFISGPFGQGSTRLTGNNGEARLTLPNQDPVSAPSAEFLMEKYLGWQFPVLDIRYWVKGQASPHSPSTAIKDESGLLESLNQHNWQIEFSRYNLQSGNWLPSRIKIKGHDFKFTLVIKEWNIHD